MEKRAPNLARLPDEPVSELTSYSALIITVTVVATFLFKQYVLEMLVVRKWPLYRETWARLNASQRRGFAVHNMGAAMKMLLICFAFYPFVAVAFGGSTFQTPVSAAHARPTMGDMWVITMQIFQVMYFFELFHRDKISPLSTAHHVGTIVLGQVALALTLNIQNEPDAIQEFGLCFVWGAFDTIGTLIPHIAMIVYRLYPHRHQFLARIFYASAIFEAVCPVFETVVIMWIFGSLWDQWTLQMKIITPILHVVFKAAQLWGVRVFVQLAKKEEKLQAQFGPYIRAVQDSEEPINNSEECRSKSRDVIRASNPFGTSRTSTLVPDNAHEDV